MSQSTDFVWLIQAPNIFKHISRNGGATMKASRKTAHDKVFFILGQKGNFPPKNGGTMKHIIALNLYIGSNVLVYERRLMVKVWSMTKFCVKKTFSAKIDIFSLKMTQLKIVLCLTQAPNTAMQIYRNKGATKKAPTKTFYGKVLAKKVTFIKNIVVLLKQSISHKSVHWYQWFSLWKMLDGECLVDDKEKFLF